MSDTFGFTEAKKTTREKLAGIQPSAPDSNEVPLDKIDAVAEAQGFPSREIPAANQEPAQHSLPLKSTLRKKRRDMGPRVPINMMVPEKVAAPFIAFCDDNRYTYWEGVQELMRRAKLI